MFYTCELTVPPNADPVTEIWQYSRA